MNDKKPTRYYSDIHEKSVCKALGARQQSNSGAGLFAKGDVIRKDASLLVECKTCVSDKNSFSVKREWIDKNTKEANEMNLSNSVLCFNFGPGTDNYYIISEKTMKFLVDKLVEDGV